MVGFSRKQPNDYEIKRFGDKHIVHFRIGQIMHNNQIGCLARRYISIFGPPVSEGFPRGIRASRDWNGGRVSPPPGSDRTCTKGWVQRVSSVTFWFGLAVVHPIADGVPRYTKQLGEILHLHAKSFVFRHDISPCNGYVVFFSLYIKEIKLSFL